VIYTTVAAAVVNPCPPDLQAMARVIADFFVQKRILASLIRLCPYYRYFRVLS
jgi:hypothetical protein